MRDLVEAGRPHPAIPAEGVGGSKVKKISISFRAWYDLRPCPFAPVDVFSHLAFLNLDAYLRFS